MATIKISYENEPYILEYDRASVEHMINRGLTREEIINNPFSYPELFYGAFRKNYPYVNRKVTDKIWEKLPNKEQIISVLIDMYAEPIQALVADPEDQGNVTWEINE